MTFTFDLITQPWIPVLRDDGGFAELGLRDVLVQSPRLREVAHDSPLFVASIHPLLTAIMHRVLPGETDRERKDEWQRLWRQGRFGDADVEAIDAYFARWRDRFDLFHPQFPFYQVAGLEIAGNKMDRLSRLAIEEQLNSDAHNVPKMFANDADPDWQAPSPALAARLLVTIQNFALGFGNSSRAKIADKAVEPPYTKDGPLLRGLNVWMSGETFFQTLMLCLVPHELSVKDAPCWELDAPHELRDQLVNGKRRTVAPRGVCDLLTLQSRLIRLLPEKRDGKVIVPLVFFTQGRSLEKDEAGRPSSHPLKLYKEDLSVLALSEDRAIWRDAHALLKPESRKRGEYNLFDWAAGQATKPGIFGADFRPNLNVVGMAPDARQRGKFLLWRHDRLPLPPMLLCDLDLVGRIRSANEDAELVAREMRRRFALVARTFVAGGRDSGVKPDPDDVNALVGKFDPRRAFWSRLENYFYELLKRLPEQPAPALSEWEANVKRAAQECLRAACNALGTSPRAVTAVAQIDVGQPFNLAYLRDPKSFLAAKRERGRAAKTTRKTSARKEITS